MSDQERLSIILVGDHLGQVKKVLWPSGEISVLQGCASPQSSNPVVSIEPLEDDGRKQLIANKNGELYVYDCVRDETRAYKKKADDSLIKALPIGSCQDPLFLYDKRASIGSQTFKLNKNKNEEIKNGIICQSQLLAYVGIDIPLKVMDIESKKPVFVADRPEANWLGIKPEVFVSGLDTVGTSNIATCSRSDSVIRLYDIRSPRTKAVISAQLDQEAFNEHADSARFFSIASTRERGHCVVAGSNVGQIVAIDLRLHPKQNVKLKRKKMQPRAYKVLGGFKGARGGSIKDVKMAAVGAHDGDGDSHKVISCCLDRYLRVHNFTRTSRHLEKHVYISTKPFCCSPILYSS